MYKQSKQMNKLMYVHLFLMYSQHLLWNSVSYFPLWPGRGGCQGAGGGGDGGGPYTTGEGGGEGEGERLGGSHIAH